MIDVGNCYFACDECPISEGVEHRLRAAKEGGYDPQFEYCGCDKVQTEFFISGCCEDAYVDKPRKRKKGKRKTGMEYRRTMAIKHRDDLMWIINHCGYNPMAGYVDWDWVDGKWQPVGSTSNTPKILMLRGIGNATPTRSFAEAKKSIVETSIENVLTTGGRCIKRR